MSAKSYAVKAVGVLPILFDRYAGDNDTTLATEDKFYTVQQKGKPLVCLPATSLYGMLSSNFRSCATKLKYGRSHATKTNAIQGFIDIAPSMIPFKVSGKDAIFNGFDGEVFDEQHDVARIKKSAQQIIPNPVTRPRLNTPWELEFEVTIYDNPEFKARDIEDLLNIGGSMIGVGAWRGRYGKFAIDTFDEIS